MHRLCVLIVAAAAGVWGQTQITGALAWQERWDHYVDRTFNWKRIAGVTAESAFQQTFQLSRCGRPPYCFPHDLSGALMRRTARTTLELGAGALLREDIRRRPSEVTGFRKRIVYSLKHAALARGPNGDWRPAYSRYAGTAAAVVVWSAWDGRRPMTASFLGRSFGFSAGSYFQDALFTEFGPDMKRMAFKVRRRFDHSSRNAAIGSSPADRRAGP